MAMAATSKTHKDNDGISHSAGMLLYIGLRWGCNASAQQRGVEVVRFA
jgi:hypothetical protein